MAVTIPYWSVFQNSTHPPILSVSAGIGITYVFLTLLPKLAEVQALLNVTDAYTPVLPIGLQAYLVALAGFVVFLVTANKGLAEEFKVAKARVSFGEVLIFGVFGLYYAQIGFLLGEWPSGNWFGYLVLVFAFGMHFVGINFHIWKRYPRRYPKFLRWVFCACLILGWIASLIAGQLSVWTKFATMFVAGGIIIMAIREEIPPEKDAHIVCFLVSVVAATAFILFAKTVLLR
ncbi:hypothetical protein [Microbulbifer aggregans]|uniref:hypothetical protein n=1 Tax=Microbulbifer aggregans TaxID=1769779 RepID=UPI001CFD3F9B|nr:hypothetical protein [Microbulbifer aggregans]